MHEVNARAGWVILAIVLAYLIARPHIGTTWAETGYFTVGKKSWTLQESGPYLDSRECQRAKERDQNQNANASNVTIYNCDMRTALLWGW